MDKIKVLGYSVSIFSKDEIIEYLEESLLQNQPIICFGYSVGLIQKFYKDKSFFNLMNSFDIMVTDGRLFYLILKWLNVPLKFDLSVPRLTLLLFEIANRMKKNVYIFGGTDEMNLKALSNVKKDYPNIGRIIGSPGYNYDEEKIMGQLESNEIDILFIGMPSKFKELFAAKVKSKCNVKIIVPFGGMIEVLAGDKKITPLWMKKLGLAWFFRFIQAPITRFHRLYKIAFFFLFIFLPKILMSKLFPKKLITS